LQKVVVVEWREEEMKVDSMRRRHVVLYTNAWILAWLYWHSPTAKAFSWHAPLPRVAKPLEEDNHWKLCSMKESNKNDGDTTGRRRSDTNQDLTDRFKYKVKQLFIRLNCVRSRSHG